MAEIFKKHNVYNPKQYARPLFCSLDYLFLFFF